ncbi:MAG TPA: HAMP domain-containing sensor histidine kinase [Candidatus Binatia bacterium]|nr:HAMP domain-containing sensor histidine kinase [Candidatus Binatia bacterium]
MKQPPASVSQSFQSWWQSVKRWWNEPVKQATIFRSARLKLTVFYLGILVVISLSLTLSTRALAEHEFNNAGMGERGVVRHLLFGLYSVPIQPPNTFNVYQNSQESIVKQHLDDDVIIINLAALVIGGWLSYWYAGRTLKPIEEAHEAQSRFAADASHELRTPLANLRVENEVFLHQKDFTPSEAKQLIESNLEEVQRLENLASNLLALTHYGQTRLELSLIDLEPVIEAVKTQLSKAAQDKGITLDSDIQSGKVVGNFDSLVQLVAIVLDNALKYGPKDSKVYLQGRRQAGRYSLSIRDEGPGIAVQDLPHIFERLYRGDKARSSKVGGYGLGLSLAREIVKANRGSIEVDNYPSGGAVFTMTFSLKSAREG